MARLGSEPGVGLLCFFGDDHRLWKVATMVLSGEVELVFDG